MAHRDFDAAAAEHDDEPITFTAAGRKFTARRTSAGPLLRLARLAQVDLDELPLDEAIAVFDGFLSGLVVEKAEWEEALDELDLDQLFAITQWLIETMTGRPTQRRSSSGASPSSNGRSSRRTSTQKATSS